MVRRHPLVSYFALAYLITWTLWTVGMIAADRAGVSLSNEDNFHHAAGLLAGDATAGAGAAVTLFLLGQFGPLVSALVVTGASHGSAGLRDLASRMTRWRVPPVWHSVVVVLPLALAAVSLAAAVITGGAEVGPFTPKVTWAARRRFWCS